MTRTGKSAASEQNVKKGNGGCFGPEQGIELLGLLLTGSAGQRTELS